MLLVGLGLRNGIKRFLMHSLDPDNRESGLRRKKSHCIQKRSYSFL